MRLTHGVIAAAALLILSRPPVNAQQPGRASTPEASAMSAVTAKVWVDKDQIPKDSVVRLWVMIENGLPYEIENIAFDEFETPGFKPRDCWVGHTPSCQKDNSTALKNLPRVVSHDRLILWSTMTRLNQPADGGKVLLTGTFHWTEIKPVGRSQRAFIGPLEQTITNASISSGAIELLPTTWYKTSLGVFLKDFIMPSLIGVGGLVGGWVLYRYQQDRTERQAIWTQMLEKVTHDTEHHYLPIASAAGEFIDNVNGINNGNPAIPGERALFAMLWFDSNVRQFFRKKGGWYFKVRDAEEVVEATWELYKKSQRRAIPRDVIDEAVGLIRPDAIYTNCKTKVTAIYSAAAQPDPSKTVGELFSAWIKSDDFKADIPLSFEILRNVMTIEINRPFEKWYDTPQTVNVQSHKAYIKRLGEREARLKNEKTSATQDALPALEENLRAVRKLRLELEKYRDSEAKKHLFGFVRVYAKAIRAR
jgi:hypothetical protein